MGSLLLYLICWAVKGPPFFLWKRPDPLACTYKCEYSNNKTTETGVNCRGKHKDKIRDHAGWSFV